MFITCVWWARDGISTEDTTVTNIKSSNWSNNIKKLILRIKLKFLFYISDKLRPLQVW